MFTTKTISSVSEVEAECWDSLVGDDDPFVEHGFLSALEESGSVGPGSGWTPQHVVVMKGDLLVGALPLYLKEHSFGEYIFDWAWADASQRLGAPYYPKLVSMAPFTPATGRRILTHPKEDSASVTRALLDGAADLARALGCSSLHLLFLTKEELHRASEAELRPRLSLQFHFHNAGYASFEAFLSTCRASARKKIRRERQRAVESGLVIRTKEGPELSEEDWSALRSFYLRTCAKKGSYPYLQPAFFDALQRRCCKRVVAVLAYDRETPVAGTLNFEKGKHLYGRYWGSCQEHDMLHFELCYYRLIERAIERGQTRFEAGAQGAHKVRRGFVPSLVYSAHWLSNPILDSAVADFLPREAAATERDRLELAAHLPFHRTD